MTSLKSSLRLALINKAKSKESIDEKGFTLIELMVVVGIVGVLSAVALPQFLGVRDKAAFGSGIGEAIGLAKECSGAISMRGPFPGNYDPNPTTAGITITGGTNDNCNGGTRATAPGEDVIYTSAVAGIEGANTPCGPDPDDELLETERCVITVDNETGVMTFTTPA